MSGKWGVEKVSVSSSVRTRGESFVSWSVVRSDGKPMSVSEARDVTMEVQRVLDVLVMMDAFARGGVAGETVRRWVGMVNGRFESLRLGGLDGSSEEDSRDAAAVE
jgi:hypothetical protein